MRKKEETPYIEFDPNAKYSAKDLETLADQYLREDSRSEMCKECGKKGSEVGESQSVQEGAVDAEGNTLVVDWPEYECENGHSWFKGEGDMRGIGGDNPILFKEHFDSRKRREIYNQLGTPDPSIVSGIYNRVHPQGRKVNSDEQRQKNGASFYR